MTVTQLPRAPGASAVPELERAAVIEACLQRTRDVAPQYVALARRVLEDLDPARWTLEWCLPRWLGVRLGLSDEVAGQLGLGNVLGLASVRLEDDLADDEIDPGQADDAAGLRAVLYDEALAVYRGQFAFDSPIWGAISRQMSEWRATTRRSTSGPTETATVRVLAGRGAPLKISAFAACLVADRADLFPALERCLDHALAALVLHDDAQDWREDLAADRWNAFVARLSGQPQSPENRERNRAAVLTAMITADATRRYYGRIGREARRSARLADNLELAPMAEHLRGFATRNVEHGAWLERHYHGYADDAAAIVFGAVFSAPAGVYDPNHGGTK